MNAKLDGEFREFMHARWPVMVRLAYGLTGDQGHAEDVAQAAFARAYASWPRVSRAGDPDAYVRQIVVNENRNRFRRRRVTERLTDSPPESGLADVAWTDTTRRYDERDLHGQLEAAFEAITPRPAPVDGAARRGRAIRVRRRVAVAAGAAAVVAIGVLAVPSLLHQTASPAPASPAKPYTVTVQAPGPHSVPGLIASGTIDGKLWQLTEAKPVSGGPPGSVPSVTTSGPAFGGDAASAPAVAVDSGAPVFFDGLTAGNVQVQFGTVRAGVTYIAVRLDNGTVLVLHPVTVYGLRAVAFAVPVGAEILDATAYSRHGEIAAAIPFNAPGGVAAFGVWLNPGQHGLARASGRIGSGTANGIAWSVTAFLGPWGICIQAPATGITSAYCVPTSSDLDLNSGATEMTGDGLTVAAGHAPASAAWVIVKQPDGTTTKVWPVTVGGQKLFAFQLQTGPNPLTWTAYDNSGHVVAWPTIAAG